MPLNGSGVASKPAGTTATSNTTIESAKFNSVIDDIYSILNTAPKFADGSVTAPNGFAADPNTGFYRIGADNLGIALAGVKHVDLSTTGAALLLKSAPTSSGTDTITLAWPVVASALASEQIVAFKAGGTNTGAATLNLNSLGAKAVRKIVGGTDVALDAGDIASGRRYIAIYDSAANAAAGAWVLFNPASVVGAPSINGGPLDNADCVINGDFDIWQRGTSLAAASLRRYLADCWLTNSNGSTVAPSRQSFAPGQTAVPGNPRYFHRAVVVSSAGASNFATQAYPIEGVQKFAGETVTVTFYGEADATKNIGVELLQNFGTGGSPSTSVSTPCGLKSLTTSFGKVSFTVAVPSISGKTLGSNGDDTLTLFFWFDAGSSFATRASSVGQQSGSFDISHVSIGKGDKTAETDAFVRQPLQTTQAQCERYYEKSFLLGTTPAQGAGTSTGEFTAPALRAGAATEVMPTVVFKTRKRPGTITVTTFNPTSASAEVRDVTAGGNCSATATVASETGFNISCTGNAGTAVGNALSFHWTAENAL